MVFPAYDRVEVCAIQFPFHNLIIIAIYLPPGILEKPFADFCKSFVNVTDDMLNQFPCHRLVVAGDFNRYNCTFLSSNFSLSNIVTGATRLNANLDLIFVDDRLFTSYAPDDVVIGPPIGSSDHNVVIVRTHGLSNSRSIKKHVIFDLRESRVLDFEQKFLSNDFEAFYSSVDVEDACKLFYDFMNDALNVIPRKTVFITNADAPWMTPLIKHLIEERWNAYRCRNWAIYNSLKLKVKEEILRAKKNFFQKKMKNVKGLWAYVNMERGTRKGDCSPLFDFCGRRIDAVLNALNNHFCSVMTSSSTTSASFEMFDDSWCPSFGVEDIWQLLHRLPLKATGSDDIPTKLYKMSAVILAEPLYHLLVLCFRNRKFPRAWKIADVAPVPKSNGQTVEDYRPISLLPIPAKLVEKLILKDLRGTFTRYLGDTQFGIRKILQLRML